MVVSKVCLQTIAVIFCLVMAGCATGELQVKVKEEVLKPPLILLATGKKLGVDFSNPIFAKQTKCYDDPSRLFGNPHVTISSICYNTEGLITNIGWARKDLSLNDYVKKSIDGIAIERALKGIKNTDKKTIVFLEEKNGISYHKVSIGDDYEGVQGTLFIHTREADTLGLTVVITVKGKNPEAVKNRMEKIKGAAMIISPLSFEPTNFFMAEVKTNMFAKININIFPFIERSYAKEHGADPESADSPGLTTSDGTPVTDSSGNQIGTGGGDTAVTGGADGSAPAPASAPASIDGVCMPTHNNCSSGTTAIPSEDATRWIWGCYGSNGGSDVSCTENKPLPTGSLSASPVGCQIPTGASTCATTLTWSTTNPRGTSGVTRDGTAGLLFSGNTDSRSTNVPYEADQTVIYRLYNNASEIGTASVTVGCLAGVNKWDSTNNECADPKVASAVVAGEYYPPGTITLTCTNSDTYRVTLNGSPFAGPTAYTGPVVIPNLTQEGNYVISCIHGTVSDQVTRYYDAIPPPSIVSLLLSPVTIGKDGKVTVSWKTKFPTNACALTAKVVCPNNACSSQQTTAQTNLNTILQSEKTDDNDSSTSRLITTAVKKVAPGQLGTDWLALGKKTLQITYTTDLTYDCGNGQKQTKRIKVTKSDLQ